MNMWALIPLVSCLTFAILFVLVLQQARRRVDKIFATFLFVSAVWSFTSFMLVFNPSASSQQLIFWNGMVIVAIPWVVVSYYHFVRAYNNKPGGIVLYLGYGFVLTILVLSLSGYVVKSATLVDGYLYHDIKPWDYVLMAVLMPLFLYILLMLARRYRRSLDPVDRNRTLYLMTGWIVLVVISYITPLSPTMAGLPTDHIGNLANALIISYAIYRFHLLDIRLVVRRGLAYLILVGALVGISTGAVFLGQEFFPDQPVYILAFFATLIALLLVVVARPLSRVLQQSIDRLFYRETYAYRRTLLGFSSKMAHILNLGELAKEMLPAMTKALSITQASLLLQNSDSGDFTVSFTYPKAKNEPGKELVINADNPIINWLDKKDAPLNPEQIDNIPEFKGLWQEEKERLTTSGLGLLYPLKSRDKLIGILALGKKKSGGLYPHEDIGMVTTIATQAGIIIENAQLFTQATVRATTDELTGLHNHRNFHERLEQEIARGSRFGSTFSLIMMDIDLFKAYNDIYGHLAGDQILRRVGRYLESSIRGIDLAFRYGGEEFTIILPEARLDDAYKVAERIRKTIESKTSSRAMPITVSIGIGNWPNDGVMKEEIIGRADAALYRAKQTGRNRTCLSSDVMKPETPLIGVELEARPRALSIIYALAATVDAKDSYTYGHSRKVSEYAVAMSEALKLAQDKLTTLRAAGLLHDIGKVGVPDSILNKKAPLEDNEWKPIKAHPELGVEILRHVIDLVNCLPAIRHHHEHYDGRGYPAGLRGDKIPMEARVLAVADAYDAMTSPRPYRKQLSSEKALEELKRCAGTQFDPQMVEILCNIIKPSHPKSLETKTRKTDEDQAQ